MSPLSPGPFLLLLAESLREAGVTRPLGDASRISQRALRNPLGLRAIGGVEKGEDASEQDLLVLSSSFIDSRWADHIHKQHNFYVVVVNVFCV